MGIDERARSLERRWRESGDPDAGARLLRDRLATGEADLGEIALAAWLGDDAARRALDDDRHRDAASELASDDEPAELPRWIGQLKRFGKTSGVRAAIAAQELLLAEVDAEVDPELHEAIDDAVRFAIGWLRCPCGGHESLAVAHSGGVIDRWQAERADATGDSPAADPGEHPNGALDPLAPARPPPTVDSPLAAWLDAAAALAATRLGETRVRAAIRDALIPWTLGRRDPLEARLDGR